MIETSILSQKWLIRKDIWLLIFIGLFGVSGLFAQQMTGLKEHIISNQPKSGQDFPIVSVSGVAAGIIVDPSDFEPVLRAAKDLRSDIKSVTGELPPLLSRGVNKPKIVIGTLGRSKLIDSVLSKMKLDPKSIRGKWESFIILTTSDPKDSTQKILLVLGSDMRGTIYGIYELSQQLGVSPWHWWADVPPKTRASAYVLAGEYTSTEPKVKYRGIFINDEEPAFGGWARERFGGINSKMYGHIFELLLRLRANYFWPAMWGKAFNEDDPNNPKLANAYGIVVGTSHHEPMMRAQKEWTSHHKDFGNGEWNYTTNSEGLRKFWKEGFERNKMYDNLVTMGMRGDGDMPMAGANDDKKNIELLEKIIADQRKIIKDVTHKPANQTPQVWTLYSEVQKYYDQGMKIPDDVIIMLCDDNWGDVRRLPDLGGKKHLGGYGMYYHVDLHGAPRCYQWLNMTQIPHMWEQLQLTYSYGVDKIWMLNVGDLKPMEYPITFFMNMAWDPDSFNAGNLQSFTKAFCAEQFGSAVSDKAAEILSTYCKYNSRISAEMLNSHTYNLESGEFKEVRDSYLALETEALRLYLEVPDSERDAFNELILFPVQAMANLYDLYYAVAMNEKYAKENDVRANKWADHAVYCFERDSSLCYSYNHDIADGKWNHMMDQVHIGYRSWDAPRKNIMPRVTKIDTSSMKQGGYVFNERNGVVAIEAEHFFSSAKPNNTEWTVINGLGRTLSGIALMPYTVNPGSAGLTYKAKFDVLHDSVDVHLIFNSTLPFNGKGMRVAIGFDDNTPITVNINKDLTWDHNYDKMYPAAAARIIEITVKIPIVKGGASVHNLHLRPLDPGVVFEKIVIDNGGYEKTFLKMPESPYLREYLVK